MTGDRALKEVLKRQSPPPFWVKAILAIIQLWFFIYDCLNYIPYEILSSPTEKLRKSNRIKARPLRDGDAGSPWRNTDNKEGLVTEVYADCPTLDRVWKHMVRLFGDSDCLGTRRVIRIHREKQQNGRVFEKLELGEYMWETYESVDERQMAIGYGLRRMGHRDGEKVCIFAETRAEWTITALACFTQAFPVVTVYATLGEEAIAHAINEVEATTIVTTAELLPKVQSIVSQCGTLKRAVYMEAIDPESGDADIGNLRDYLDTVISFEQLEDDGEAETQDMSVEVKGDDLAVIMYTSGTTGLPKGVMLSHSNLVAAMGGIAAAVNIITDSDTYIGYLPLAHVLELAAELTCLSRGCRIGYSSPLTLHDRGSKIRKGTRGDCYALRPTLFTAVPAIMDRIFKAVSEEVASSSRIMQEFFRLTYERKRNRLEEGYDSPFMNRIVFKKIRGLLGGRLKGVLSGGAPLNAETQRFMNICFCCPVVQGYGLTETCGAASVADVNDLKTGSVGPPVPCSDIMLRPWTEGGYKPTNEVPQGEVLIGGENVAKGYWKNEAKTREDFVVIGGRRWFASGDIGEFREDGSLKIIDRKKDLVKLSDGEYVSLASVETKLLTAALVDNICVYGNSEHEFLIALVVPNQKKIEQIALQMGIDTSNWEELCKNVHVTEAVRKELTEHGLKNKVRKAEVPGKIHLCSEAWTPESGLLTEALKLKRKPIQNKYSQVIDKLYARN